jgi:gliding motility-associated-like protein
VCNGGNTGTATVTAGGGVPAYTYAWAPGGQTNTTASGLTAGTYTVTITDANGCTLTVTALVNQPTALNLTAAGFPVTCNGGSDGQATAIPAGGSPAYTYVWSNGNTTANANNLTAGNYTITVTDAHGCSHDTVVTVSQPAPIVVTFTADSLNGCAPLCATFKDLSTDPGGIITKWNWSFGDGGTDTLKNPHHCYLTPGQYTVTLTVVDNHGCTSTLVINNMINVYSFPVAAFDFGPQPATIVDPTISFTDKSTDAYGIASWQWTFGDAKDGSSKAQNPSYSYADTGNYCVTLLVTNVHGCADSVTHCLVISSEYTLYIPNAFSPNADGKNDVFLPKGEYVNDYKMYIFDRWGMMLFYSDDMNKGWDGTVNGGTRICQEDTYVYLIEVTDNLGKKHSYMGRVTLIQ